MTTSNFCLVLSLLACSLTTHAASKERRPDASLPVLMAAVDPSVLPIHLGFAGTEARPESAGKSEALPSLPSPATNVFMRALRVGSIMPGLAYRMALHMAGAVTLPDAPGVSLLQSSPLAAAARRIGAQNFNTQDGSSVDAFAICYRLSNRSSLQVIPGDPAPVKIPVSAMANNMGVTVGMVVRLSAVR